MNDNFSPMDIPKAFDNKKTEKPIFELWEQSGYFTPESIKNRNKGKSKKPFVMTLPPPNANGSLHLGHVSGYTYQDLMGRYYRMNGRPTLLLPGKDHAGIQTEVLFDKVLEKKGLKKREIGREKFYEMCYEFCMENSQTARQQEKNIGLSADYAREKFTLDPELSSVIMETFEKMFKEGLIYRGKRIINWCTKDQTSLANIDTEKIEEESFLYHINYKLKDKEGYITVATTRPETMFGDTAVAVNPKDKKYSKLIGSMCVIPIVNKEIPIIADQRIDKSFGTGAVKVTPAHSEVDYEISKDHDLPIVTVINRYGKMIEGLTDKYAGMNINLCREQLVKDLENLGSITKKEAYTHTVSICERCKGKIEPMLQRQWFIDVSKIKGAAVKAVTDKQTKIIPKSQEKLYLRWMDNLEDWNISRQLWWGHRIPVWYCESKEYCDQIAEGDIKPTKDKCGNIFVSIDNKPEICPNCHNKNLEQETDVLDTWFSSGHWPFSTLGGVNGKDYNEFYPTNVMETGFDILFFWIARMMLIGTYRTNKAPFETVYLHGLVTDKEGKKMSKSRGNGVDPHEMIEKYGADAVRFSFVHSNSPAQNYRIYEEKIDSFRKFVNKVWNGSRFAMFQFSSLSEEEKNKVCDLSIESIKSERIKELEAWCKQQTKNIEDKKFGIAAVNIYDFWWHTFCDKFIEDIKNELKANEENKELVINLLAELLKLLKTQLKVMHPFIPFVTEEIWQTLGKMGLLHNEEEFLMIANWPE